MQMGGRHYADWAVVYADLSVYTSDDGPPESAPPDGVQCIGLSDPEVGYEVHEGTSYYVWREGIGWQEMDERDFVQYRMSVREPILFLFGFAAPRKMWAAAWDKLRELEEAGVLPPKSAYRKTERRF